MGSDDHGVSVALLGPLDVSRNGQPILVGAVKQRIMLAVLALDPGRVVSVGALVAAIWGDPAPAKAAATLQVYASALRRLLGDRELAILRWQLPGYKLEVTPEATDIGQFTILCRQAAHLHRDDRLALASDTYGRALDLWRGRALADLADRSFAVPVVAQLEQQRLDAIEERTGIDLILGRYPEAVAAAQAVVAHHPLRERAWAQLMTGLYHCGRQADALAAYQHVRVELAEQLGLNPSPDLQRREQDILHHTLARPGTVTEPPSASQLATERGVDTACAPITAWIRLPDGQRLPLNHPRITIGRSDDCDIVLPDSKISRRHAVIRQIDGTHQLLDADSTNGTRVNGQDLTPRTPHSLCDSDEITLGSRTLRYERT
jgi:SARP family transcriptional regulator, regulator of embCAB operon